MKEEDEFYIGWQEQAPRAFSKAGWIFSLAAILIVAGFAVFFTRAEKGFVANYFDYGNLTEVKGQLVMEPVPALLTKEEGIIKTIPLVGFGKFGAGPVLEGFKTRLGENLSAWEVVVRGTYFEFQDKRWMELTEGDQSLVSHVPAPSPERAIDQRGNVTLSGEIVDPKCFFGVMNPATKAIHRSCARRCISGGIVPVLAIREKGKFVDYYLLEDIRAEDLSQEILPFVGVPVTLTGQVIQYDDWKVLEISSKTLSQAQVQMSSTIARCE